MESRLVLVEPLAVLGWALAATCIYVLARRAHGRWALLVLTGAYFWFTTPLGANAMLGAFEHHASVHRDCHPAPDAWIVVLAGGIDEGAFAPDAWDRLHGDTLKRTLAGIQLALREPGRKLLMSGGSGDSAREADIMADVARAMGVDASRVAVERGSHNTFESAAASARILAAEHAPREVLLVTSALHMVRAVASFETHGLLACPRPMDFRWVSPPASHALIPQASALRKSNDVVHEAAGLAYYRVAGMLSAGSTR